MDIIPIIPAPQQGITPDPTELPAGDDNTGFNLLLTKELAAGEQSSQQSNTEDTEGHTSNGEKPDSSNPKLSSDSILRSLLHSIKYPNEENKLEKDAAEQPLSATLQAAPEKQEHSVQPKISDEAITFHYSETVFRDALQPIPEEQPHTPHNQRTSFLDFFNLSALLHYPVQPSNGQVVQATGVPDNSDTIVPQTPLQLHSTASAFSIKNIDALHTIAFKQTTVISDSSSSSPFGSIVGRAIQAELTVTPTRHNFLQSSPSFFSSPSEWGGKGPAIDGFSSKSSVMQAASMHSLEQPAVSISGQSATTMQSTIMIEELQKLIGLNNVKDTLHISHGNRTTNETSIGSLFPPPRIDTGEAPRSTSPATAELQSSVVTDSIHHSAELPAQAKSSLGRNAGIETVQEQLVSSKAIPVEPNKEQTNSSSSQQNQNSPQSNNSPQQQAPPSASGSTPVSSEQVPNNSGFNSQFHDVSSNNSSDITKPGSSLSSPMSFVRDHEILNQIVDRFSIQSHLQTSRLSLQLNPAELGELKIELIVKGDVLKANIYAQTHQAGEIIDRNLPRLREILQSQGLSVDDLVVTFKSDSIDNFSSQHGQLFQDQNHQMKDHGNSSSSTRFENTIEEILLTETEKESGVNLTI